MPGLLNPNTNYDPLRILDSEVTTAVAQLATWAPLLPAQLVAEYALQPNEWQLFVRLYDIRLWLCFRYWYAGLADVNQTAVLRRAIIATLNGAESQTPTALALTVTNVGVPNVIGAPNLLARDVCFHLAMLAMVDDSTAHDDRTKAMLDKFAAVVPQWPNWDNFTSKSGPPGGTYNPAPLVEASFAHISGQASGVWGTWIHYDLIFAEPIARAAMMMAKRSALSAPQATAIEAIFTMCIQHMRWFRIYFRWTNTETNQYLGLIQVALALNWPDLIHEANRDVRNALGPTGYHADGVFSESWTYRRDHGFPILVLIEGYICGGYMAAYTDPPLYADPVDSTRYDDWGPLDDPLTASRHARAVVAERAYTMPDGLIFADRDTGYPLEAPTPEYVSPTSSHLFGSRGHGVLVSGTGSGLAMVRMGWTSIGGHGHDDGLGLALYARDTELVSEGKYITTAWSYQTAAHCTVVLNELTQTGFGSTAWLREAAGPYDAIPGVPDWPQRFGGTKAWDDQGDLIFFADRFPSVQVMEAQAEKKYAPGTIATCTMYRRTLALVRIDDDTSYVVDIFRVRGCPAGTNIDWMLHSALQSAYTLTTPGLTLTPTGGVAHGGNISTLEQATTAAGWNALWTQPGDARLETLVLGAAGTVVTRGLADSIRNSPTKVPFLYARRTDTDATFVVVHHAYSAAEGSKIVSVEEIEAPDLDCTALRVTLASGRVDTIVSCADRDTSRLVDGVEVRGRFAHVAVGEIDDTWAYLIDGDLLITDAHGVAVSEDTTYEREVHATTRVEAGDEANGFVVDSLPTDDLDGRIIIINQAGEHSSAYRVSGDGLSDDHPGKILMLTPDEPGLIIADGVVKQTYYPGWGFEGVASARILGDALVTELFEPVEPEEGAALEVHWTVIAKELARRCEEITQALGYDVTRREVIRTKLENKETYADGTIQVTVGDLDKVAGFLGAPFLTQWEQQFRIDITVQPNPGGTDNLSDDVVKPIDDDMGIWSRAVNMAIGAPDQLGGIVDDLFVSAIRPVRREDNLLAGVTIEVTVKYRTAENDLAVTPYTALVIEEVTTILYEGDASTEYGEEVIILSESAS